MNSDGRNRVVIGSVRPEIDGGRFPVKRIVGGRVVVDADVFADGHDVVTAMLQFRAGDAQNGSRVKGSDDWSEVTMSSMPNDAWRAEFTVDRVGTYYYTVVAWIDRFLTWLHELRKRAAAGQVAAVDLAIGANLIEKATKRAAGDDQKQLKEWSIRLVPPARMGASTSWREPARWALVRRGCACR